MTRRAHRAAAARDDPQSGPSRAAAPSGFFRLSAKWILAEPGRLAGVRKSRYINREGRDLNREGFAIDRSHLDEDRSLVRAAQYIARSADDRIDAVDGELGAHVLITRGLRARTGTELARLLDAAERKPDRSYRCYGGRLPRVGVHMIASFSRGISPAAAGAILEDYAQALSDRLKVPLEGQVHNDDEGQPDHVHLILGTRAVEAGVIGRKARALDAVSEKADGTATKVDGRLIGNTMEWIRSEWAARMRAATGVDIDHRSFKRQGLAITPVAYVPRTEVEYQRRRGSTAWKDRRRSELADRSRTFELRFRPNEREVDPSLINIATQPVAVAARSGDVVVDRDEPRHRPTPLHDAPGEQSLSNTAADAQQAIEAGVGSDSVVAYAAEPGSKSSQSSLSKATAFERIALLTARYTSAARAPTGSVNLTEDPVAAFLHDLGIDLPAEIVTAALRGCRPQPRERTIGDDGAERVPPSTVPSSQVRGAPCQAESIATSGTEKPPTKNKIEVEWAFRLSRLLKRKGRVQRPRLEQLATWAELPIEALEARLRHTGEAEGEQTTFEAIRQECPIGLQRMWDDWAAEDNAARRARRGGGADHPAREHDQAGPKVTDAASSGPDQADSVAAATTKTSDAPSEAGHTELQPIIEPTRAREDFIRPRSETPTPVTVPDAPPSGTDALSCAVADARDRILVEAFEADIHRRATVAEKGPVDARKLDRALALRLRVTGRNRIEVAAALGAKWSVTDEASKARIRAAVNHAFSDRTTRFIEKRKGWVARVNSLSSAVEMRFYRNLRHKTLGDLKQDLEAVWTNRALRADEARRRHAKRLDALHGIQWYARRLKRCGFVVSVLSTMVELTVLNPLLAQAKAVASAEQEAIAAAARTLSASLKERRAEWVEFARDRIRRETMPAGRHNPPGPTESKLGVDVVSAKNSGVSRPDAATRAKWLHEEERQLVGHVALGLMVGGRWNAVTSRHLARIADRSENDLRDDALQLCTQLFGHSEVGRVAANQAKQILIASMMAVRRHGWSDLDAVVVGGGTKGPRRGTAEIT